jgi:hypothetical protein
LALLAALEVAVLVVAIQLVDLEHLGKVMLEEDLIQIITVVKTLVGEVEVLVLLAVMGHILLEVLLKVVMVELV